MKIKFPKSEYFQLRIKLLLWLALMFIGPIVIVFFLYAVVLKGRFANLTVSFLQRSFGLEYDRALGEYQVYFRDNFRFFIYLAILFFFFVLFFFFTWWFVRTLRRVEHGLDCLLEDYGQEILLPSELVAIERKMNTVRHVLKERELEAQLAERRKNDLVMYLAHDIRTPLTSVIGYLSLMDEAPDMPPAQRAKYTHITLEKAYRLETLVNEFFEITRYNFQQIVLEKETIDLSYMLQQLADEFYPMLAANGNTAVLAADEDLKLYGDVNKLARVFQNILKNAAAYSAPGTEIRISAGETEDKVFVSFENEGKTIPQEKLDAIFDKFYRLDDARTTAKGGAGLGLAIAKEIVVQHGGTIKARSENRRTAFTVEIPKGQ